MVEQGLETIKKNLSRSVEKERISQEEMDEALARIASTLVGVEQKTPLLLQNFCVVPEGGLEPTRGCPHRILSPSRFVYLGR